MEMSPGVARFYFQGLLPVRDCLLNLALGGQGFPQGDHRFGRSRCLRDNLAAQGSRFTGISVGQQSIGQAETCFQRGGGQPNGLAPFGDGSIVLACVSQFSRQASMLLHARWEEAPACS